MSSTTVESAIPLDKILAIADADAITAYRDLGHFHRESRLEEGKWFIEYRLNFPKGMRVAGGGPHYIISAETGEILSKKYYQ